MTHVSARRSVACAGVDVRTTLGPFGVFRSDPTHTWWPSGFARAVRTTEGPGTVAFRWCADGQVDVEAWGPGAAWLLDAAPGWLGCGDDPSSFRPAAGSRLAELWRRHGGFRLGRSGLIWQELAVTILGQRVTAEDAMRSWRQVVDAWGEPAPGPHGLRLPPAPSALAGRCYRELHPFGVERRRADALVLAARRADRLEEAAAMPVGEALVRLSSLPGLGAWTATSTAALSHGDPDVVIVGDYGVPTLVSFAFTGSSERVGDARMFELLAPFAGHRWRVVRMLRSMGVSPPRRAPRARNPRIARL